MNPNPANFIRDRQNPLAERIVALQYARQPEVWEPYEQPGWKKSVRDAGYHLTYLAAALEVESPELFLEYLAWVKVLFASLNFPSTVLPATLECTRQVLLESLPEEIAPPVLALLETGADSVTNTAEALPSYLAGDEPLDRLARRFLQALLQSDRRSASQMILEAVATGIPLKEIYLQVFQRTQREIGRLWQTNQISVAQEHFCTAATQMIMSQLYPYIFTGAPKDRCMVVCCVGGELHEIGARMVADFFELEGWDTTYLGANTPLESVLKTVEQRGANMLALSATMTFHVNAVAQIIAALRQSRMAQIPVLVGGYPFNLSPTLWQRVGADGYAPDAETAILAAERVLQR
jgi:methanogenic corrinoid protein MtbC1